MKSIKELNEYEIKVVGGGWWGRDDPHRSIAAVFVGIGAGIGTAVACVAYVVASPITIPSSIIVGVVVHDMTTHPDNRMLPSVGRAVGSMFRGLLGVFQGDQGK